MGISKKYTNINEIIERVQRDYGFSEFHKNEAAEWVWDIVGKIGASEPYEEKQALIDIEDYRGELPYDFYSLDAVRDRTSFIELRPTSDLYHFGDYKADSTPVSTIITTGDVDPITDEEYETSVEQRNVPEYYTYKLQGGYIFTGFGEGRIELMYKAFPIDVETGLPKIPDDPKYIEAVVTYIASKVAFRLMLVDKLSDKKCNLVEQKAVFAAGAARNKALIPDPHKMETIRNLWKSPHSYYEHFETGHTSLGARDRFNEY